MNITPVLTKKEKVLVALGSAFVVFLAYLPNLLGWLYQTSEMRFNGAAIDWADVATYLVSIRTGTRGIWRFTFFFTFMPQQGHFIKMFYIVLGNILGWTRLSPMQIYTFSLLVLHWLSCLVMYRFIAEFIERPKYRMAAFLLAIFGAGIGWSLTATQFGGLLVDAGMIIPGEYPIVDLWEFDPFPIISMGLFPHYAAVMIGILGFILLYLDYRREGKLAALVGMVLVGWLILLVNPYIPILAFVVVGGLLLGDWITTRRFPGELVWPVVMVGLMQLPLLAYNFYVFTNDPVLTAFAGQNQTISGPPFYYLIGFFWLLVLCVPVFLKPKLFAEPRRIGLLAWIVGAVVLAYLPWPMQRRFLLYYTLPLAITAAIGLQEIVSPWMNKKSPFLAQRKMLLLILLLFISGFSHLYRFISIVNNYENVGLNAFYPAEVGEALEWLEEHTWEGSVMLGAKETSLLAAPYAYQHSYVAHEFESIDYDARMVQVEQFYQNEIGLDALDVEQIDWIFYGTYEQLLGPDFVPPSGYVPAYKQGSVVIYQLVSEAE